MSEPISSKERVNWLHGEMDLAFENGQDRTNWAINQLIEWLRDGLIEKAEYDAFMIRLEKEAQKRPKFFFKPWRRYKKML